MVDMLRMVGIIMLCLNHSLRLRLSGSFRLLGEVYGNLRLLVELSLLPL